MIHIVTHPAAITSYGEHQMNGSNNNGTMTYAELRELRGAISPMPGDAPPERSAAEILSSIASRVAAPEGSRTFLDQCDETPGRQWALSMLCAGLPPELAEGAFDAAESLSSALAIREQLLAAVAARNRLEAAGWTCTPPESSTALDRAE